MRGSTFYMFKGFLKGIAVLEGYYRALRVKGLEGLLFVGVFTIQGFCFISGKFRDRDRGKLQSGYVDL